MSSPKHETKKEPSGEEVTHLKTPLHHAGPPTLFEALSDASLEKLEEEHLEQASVSLLTGALRDDLDERERDLWSRQKDLPINQKAIKELGQMTPSPLSSVLAQAAQLHERYELQPPPSPNDLRRLMEDPPHQHQEQDNVPHSWWEKLTHWRRSLSTQPLAWGSSALVVVCSVMLFVTPGIKEPTTEAREAIQSRDGGRGVRSKGFDGSPDTASLPQIDIRLRLFLRRKGQIVELASGWRPRDGDELRFMYTIPSRPLHLLLFLIDEKAQMSMLYPSSQDRVHRLTPGQKKFLKGGATIESPSGTERIFACIATQPPNTHSIHSWLRDRLARKASLSQLKTLPFPCAYQKSWLLQSTPPR